MEHPCDKPAASLSEEEEEDEQEEEEEVSPSVLEAQQEVDPFSGFIQQHGFSV